MRQRRKYDEKRRSHLYWIFREDTMGDTAADDPGYVLGYADREHRRLGLQAMILQPFTERLLRDAGITLGMQVLDVGCGVGDVSLIAARLAGQNGSVTSIDIDPGALATLRQRATAAGYSNVDCVQTNVQDFNPGRLFDAVVGRHVLLHTPDPLAVLKRCHGLLQPRGVAAFQEYDFQVIPPCYPASPLRDSTFAFMNAFFAKAVHADIGSRLFHLFTEAGFPNPNCRGEFPVLGGRGSRCYELQAESIRTILPRARALGLPGAPDLDADTLEQRLRAEAEATGASFPGSIMFSCYARRQG
jgi:2-polyprenyl-3-methyl-5-hydroxy-6-metoxy-1,4-benzoquinol methylase